MLIGIAVHHSVSLVKLYTALGYYMYNWLTVHFISIHLMSLGSIPLYHSWITSSNQQTSPSLRSSHNNAPWPTRITGINWMKIVRIEQGKRRITVRDVGDMEVQKPHGRCTSPFLFYAFHIPSCSSDKCSISWYDRRQFADWLEELYDDILELIVRLSSLSSLKTMMGLMFSKRIVCMKIHLKPVPKVRRFACTPSSCTVEGLMYSMRRHIDSWCRPWSSFEIYCPDTIRNSRWSPVDWCQSSAIRVS